MPDRILDHLDPALLEQPLSVSAWQAYLPQHLLYAQRRYRYHTRLFAYGYAEFAPSLVAFQQLTHRLPDRFRANALMALQQAFAKSALSDAPATLWLSITTQPYDDTSSIDDVANLPYLCQIIFRNCRILESQGKHLRSTIVDTDAEWQAMILTLSVLMEELEVADELTLPASDSDDKLLAPYPDEAAWRRLLADSPKAALEQFSHLLVQQAQVGLRLAFNAAESMAIYRKLRRL
jgi:hypothetical protein